MSDFKNTNYKDVFKDESIISLIFQKNNRNIYTISKIGLHLKDHCIWFRKNTFRNYKNKISVI